MGEFVRRIVVTGGPWPERIGCHGVVVNDPGDGVYPFDKPAEREKNAVVLLDEDPVTSYRKPDPWTCVIGVEHIATETP